MIRVVNVIVEQKKECIVITSCLSHSKCRSKNLDRLNIDCI